MIEKKGSQYRIRIIDPSVFSRKSFVTKDVGRKGGLQLILAKRKFRKRLEIQAIRVSINDFKKVGNKLIPRTNRGRREKAYIEKVLGMKK